MLIHPLVPSQPDHEALQSKAGEVSMSVRMVSGMMSGVATELARTSSALLTYEGTVESVRGVSVDLTTQMESLVELAKQMTSVIGEIEDIAKQTRILSINATLEATRAGSHGRAFAVVANAVKSLAEQTNDATKNMQTSLKQMTAAAVGASSRTRALGTNLEGIRTTTRDFTKSLNEQAEVSTAASKYVDEAASQVDSIASILSAASNTLPMP